MKRPSIEKGYICWLERRNKHLEQDKTELLEVLKHVDEFIANGVEFGYVRLPDSDLKDPALETPEIVKDIIKKMEESE